jgi:hypothetical protein
VLGAGARYALAKGRTSRFELAVPVAVPVTIVDVDPEMLSPERLTPLRVMEIGLFVVDHLFNVSVPEVAEASTVFPAASFPETETVTRESSTQASRWPRRCTARSCSTS